MRALSLAASIFLAGCSTDGGNGATPVGIDDAGAPTVDAAPSADATGCLKVADGGASSAYTLRFDVLGYLPTGDRWAMLMADAKLPPAKYQIVDETGCAITSGTAGPRLIDTTSLAGTPLQGDRVDLSAIPGPGRYFVVLEDGGRFGPIVVGSDAYASVLPKLLQFLGAQRCGATTLAISQHASCHLYASVAGASSGDGVAVNNGYRGTVDKTTGPAVDVEGGWHDAGDYIKFVGTTSFTLAVDLLAVRDHAAAFASPAAGTPLSALRGELRWGLDWLVKMLGGTEMFHQVSGPKDHDPDWRIPELDTTTAIPGYAQRPVFRFAPGRGANLLGRSAAALALGSQVYADDPPYAAKLLALARVVYAAGKANLLSQNPDPIDFYLETSHRDDLTFGAAILAQATGEAAFASDALAGGRGLVTAVTGTRALQWGDVRALALLEAGLAFPDGSAERTELAGDLDRLAAPILASATAPKGAGAPFRYALDAFGNGTIEESLGAAAVCLAARRLSPTTNAACAEVARSQLHWLFGLNPFGVPFMVGVGQAYPKNIHHALAQAAKITLTGALVGGPTSMTVLNDSFATDPSLTLPTAASPYARWSTQDLVYDDIVANYVVNEPAIDFTAPLVFVLGELLSP
jgi:endoglucanase